MHEKSSTQLKNFFLLKTIPTLDPVLTTFGTILSASYYISYLLVIY